MKIKEEEDGKSFPQHVTNKIIQMPIGYIVDYLFQSVKR